MSFYNVVSESEESTVVSEYKSEEKRSDAYQSEEELEKEFIHLLTEMSYEYLPIHNKDELLPNLRKKLEELNSYAFTDTEWEQFYNNCISGKNDGVVEKTRRIQEDNVQILHRDNGETKNITLFDKKNIHNNKLQVIHQYEENGGRYKNRYDVNILVNGLPLVHIELKRRGVNIREAFNQIDRYQRDSFWANGGLFEYVQIFVISNGTNTKYYSNTTRYNHIKEMNSERKGKTSNSFEFTSFWADEKNRIIPDLIDFTKTFFAKHTILNILAKYCVFTSENMLLVMRPYQIVATEKMYFNFAKRKLELSRKRKSSGGKGGSKARVKVTDADIARETERVGQYILFEEFMKSNPKVKNDLYESRKHLLNGVDWLKLSCGLERSAYKNSTSLYQILTHKEEIMSNAW